MVAAYVRLDMKAMLQNMFIRLKKAQILWQVRCQGYGALVRYLRSPDPQLTVWLLRRFGARVGERTTIKGALMLDNVYQDRESAGDLSHLEIGSNCYLGEDVYLDLANLVVIGDNALLSGRVSLITHSDCHRSPQLSRIYPRTSGPVRVGQGAWLGFGVTVLCGTSIGENSVVAAGSVVTRAVASATLCAGVPARTVRRLDVLPAAQEKEG